MTTLSKKILSIGALVFILFIYHQTTAVASHEQGQDEIKQESIAQFIKRIEANEIKPKKARMVANDLYKKLKKQDYLAVEKVFDELLENKDKTEDGTSLLCQVYYSLTSSLRPSDLDMLRDWCQNSEHYSSYLIRGGFFINEGWKSRGHGYASKVSAENWESFHQKLNLAYDDLAKAYELCQTNPVIPTAMLQVIRGNSLGRQQLDKWYNIGIQIDPSCYELHKQYFIKLLPKWGGKPGEVVDFVQQAISTAPAGSIVYMLEFELIRQYVDINRSKLTQSTLDSAFIELDKILNRHTKNFPTSTAFKIDFLRLKGWCNYEKNLGEADKDFKEAIELDPQADKAWFGLAQVVFMQASKRGYQAIRESLLLYNKTIELNPDAGWYYLSRAHTADSLMMFDQCLADYTFAIEHGYGNDGSNYFKRGICNKSRWKDNPDKTDMKLALNDFNKAIEWKSHPDIFAARGDVYQAMGKNQEAIQDYSEAIKKRNDDFKYFLSRAKAYVKIGEYEKAVADAEKVITLRPNLKVAKSIIAEYGDKASRLDN